MSNPNGRVIHGHKRNRRSTRVHGSWTMMMARCYTPTATRFSEWGGRGIRVCERWHTFENFLADMGEPKQGESIDRYPNKDGDYEPGNCRWATAKEQAANRRKRTATHHLRCAICEDEFDAIMARAMYCSKKCHAESIKLRQREKRGVQ